MPPRLRLLLIYIYLFVIIYTPALGESIIFDKYIVLYILLAIVILPYILRRRLSNLTVLRNKNVIIFMLFILLASIYLMIVQVFSGVEIKNLSDTRIIQNNLINVLIVHVAVVVDQFKKLQYTKYDALSILAKLATLQGIYAFLSLVFAPLKNISNTLYSLAGGSNSFVFDSRIFGISSDFTFGTPIYHGILAAILLYVAFYSKKTKYLMYIPFVLVTTALNNRTGIVVFFVLSLFFLMYTAIKRNKITQIFMTIVIMAVMAVTFFNSLKTLSPNTYNFLNSFIEDTQNLVQGRPTGNYEVLMNEIDSFKKSNLNIFFGKGYRVYDEAGKTRAGFRSDMGYINDVFYGGIVYMLILYISFIYFVLYREKKYKYAAVLLLFIVFIVNIKGEIFRSSIVLFLFIYLKLVSQSRLETERA